jgi:hypothetical protein
MSKKDNKQVKFYEFMIYSENGVLLYFQDIVNGKIIDIEKRLEQDKDFRHRM